MSYINDALRKAQGQRDSRYERFDGIIAPCQAPPRRPRKRLFFVSALAGLLILATAALVLTLYTSGPLPTSGKGNGGSLPTLAAHPAATQTTGKPVAEPVATAIVPKVDQTATQQQAGDRQPETEALYREALLAQRKGDVEKAEALYGKAILLSPGHVQSMNNLGVLYMGQQKRDRAISMFNRAILLDKGYVDPYYNMACLHAKNNEIDESIRYLKVAMTMSDSVKKWAERDADLKNVIESPAFKKIMEGQKS